MVHGIWLQDGTARYRNRYVMTKGLEAEIRAGRALWGGVMTMTTPPEELAGPNQDPEGYKLLPGINVLRHAHRFLALGEGTAPYELSADLTTKGRYDFAGALPLGTCAHPKIDPLTGEMTLFRYGLEEPYLYWATIGRDGTLARPPEIIAEIDRGYMIHDFLVTQDHVLLVINPATFDLARAAHGENVLAWEPDLGSRIAIIPRRGEQRGIRWLQTDAFWCWHYANSWQDGEDIVTCFPHWTHPGFGLADPALRKGSLVRARINPVRASFTCETVDDRPTEFPRIDDRRQGVPSRYVMVSHRASPLLPTGSFDELRRYDLDRGTVQVHRFSGWAIGEAVFAPKSGRAEEEEGYALTFATNVTTLESVFVIIDVANFEGEPVAVVRLPRRVPLGLHGNWYPA
jgi:carotenoid cleavage dioxygenase